MLKKIKIKNFKSFKDFEIELEKFNCIVAPNNAGKSNFIESLKFLQYAIVDVKKAMEEFGGFDYVKNIFMNSNKLEFYLEFFIEKLFSLSATSYMPHSETLFIENQINIFKNLKITLTFEINNITWNKKYNISGRFGTTKYTLTSNQDLKNGINLSYSIPRKKFQKIKTFPFELNIEYFTESNNIEHPEENFKENIRAKINKLIYNKKSNKNLLYALNLGEFIDKNFLNFAISKDLFNLSNYFYSYSFYPEKIKTTHKGGIELRYDGTNLVEVINFTKNRSLNNFENISASLIGTVDELRNIKIEKDYIGRNILLLREKNKFLPFNIISDGTIHLLSILTAIYEISNKNMISFDEIEKHLHLKAINYIMELMKSLPIQITFTTQNSEIIDNLDLKNDNLIFLYRDHEGFTKAINANEIPNFRKKVKRYKNISTIIKNEVLGYLGDFDENKNNC